MSDGSDARDLTRREFHRRLGVGLGIAALATGCENAVSGFPDASEIPDLGDVPNDNVTEDLLPQDPGLDNGPAPDNSGDGFPGDVDTGGTCTVYPEQTPGPYYLDLDLLRRDITEGKEGAAMAVVIRVLSSDGCSPLRDLAVDIWHCDADGVYSGFPGQLGGENTSGQRFLRGTQVTDADGRVRFDTIVPGWYPGRTPHIHFKVHLSSATEATSQLYFPETFTATVYATPPYDERGPQDTTNAMDRIANAGGLPPLAAITQEAGIHVATLTVVVASEA
jgi:protocatechuate 3,4-dioxygenase beta subunit